MLSIIKSYNHLSLLFAKEKDVNIETKSGSEYKSHESVNKDRIETLY